MLPVITHVLYAPMKKLHSQFLCMYVFFSGDVCGPLMSMQQVFFCECFEIGIFFHDIREIITHAGNGFQ